MKFLDIKANGFKILVQQFPISFREYNTLGDKVGPRKDKVQLIQGIAVTKRDRNKS